MERNQIIAIVVIIVIVASVGVAWIIMNPGTAPPSAKDTIVYGTTDSVEESIDPAQSYDYFGWEIITSVGSGLVDIIPGSQAGPTDIQAGLATSWTRSTDGKQWDFTLRQGLTWQNGWPFNATCVKWSFDRNMGERSLALQEDGPQNGIGYSDIIDNVTVLGTYSVRFNLKISFAPFLQLMSCAASYIVSPAHASDTDYVHYNAADVNASNPMGLGPYILTEWERTGGVDTAMKLVANPNYWNTSLPRTKNIIINFYTDESSLSAALSSGAVDVAYRHLTPAQTDSYKGNADYKVWEGVGSAIQYLCFQQNIYPYNETLIREGIAAALNRTNVAQTVFQGTVDPLYSIIPAGMAFHKDSFKTLGDANYTFTQQALAQFGYNSNNKLVVELYYETTGHYPSSAEQAAVYKSDLEASGVITVNLNGVEYSTLRTYRSAGSMPVFIYGWYPDYVDPDDYAFLPFASWLNLGFNSTYPAEGAAQNALWLEGRGASTSAARQTAYYELQDLQATDCSIVPLWQGRGSAVSVSNIGGVVLDITSNWRMWLLYWT